MRRTIDSGISNSLSVKGAWAETWGHFSSCDSRRTIAQYIVEKLSKEVNWHNILAVRQINLPCFFLLKKDSLDF